MKSLHVGKYFPPYSGGMETYLRDLMKALARRNIGSSALVHQSDLSLRSSREEYGAGEGYFAVTRAAVWARVLFTPISPSFPLLLNKALKRENPDILHLHMPNVSTFWALFLPRARRIPWVIQWQSDVLASRHSLGLRIFYGLYRPFERAILKRAATVIASSPPYLESSEALRDFRDKCEVVPLGLDPDSLEHAGNTEPAPTGAQHNQPLQVLAIGRLTYYKGFEYLVRACAAVDNVQIHLVGKGELEQRLKTLSETLGVTGKIFFHGHLSDDELAAHYRRCDCLCLPSIERSEAFGLVLLEAMYCGKATIASDVPGSGMGWIVQHQNTGLKTLPEDTNDLADALRYLEGHRDEVRQFGKNGRQRFDQKFHIDRCAAGVAGIYESLCPPGTVTAVEKPHGR